MGEAKQEEAKAAEAKAEEKKEEKLEEKKEEKKEETKEEEKKEETKPSPPPPPPPVILGIDMHCVGCAKKIERCLLKCKGVEEVETDMANNQLKIKGVVDPQALCSRLQKKTMRSAKVISPLPQPDGDQAADSTKSQVVASQVSGVTTVELHVNMHCEACAQQLRRKILKMRGVQAAETELGSCKVTVTGTMTGDKLVDYIYRRTGKLAKVIPPPPPPEEEKKEEAEKKPEEKKEEKPAEENAEKKEEEKTPPDAAAEADEKKDEKAEEAKKEGEANMQFTGPEDMVKRMTYWNHNGGGNYFAGEEADYYYGKQQMPVPWTPVYVIEHHRPPPPPQLFSDENPNACCIS